MFSFVALCSLRARSGDARVPRDGSVAFVRRQSSVPSFVSPRAPSHTRSSSDRPRSRPRPRPRAPSATPTSARRRRRRRRRRDDTRARITHHHRPSAVDRRGRRGRRGRPRSIRIRSASPVDRDAIDRSIDRRARASPALPRSLSLSRARRRLGIAPVDIDGKRLLLRRHDVRGGRSVVAFCRRRRRRAHARRRRASCRRSTPTDRRVVTRDSRPLAMGLREPSRWMDGPSRTVAMGSREPSRWGHRRVPTRRDARPWVF